MQTIRQTNAKKVKKNKKKLDMGLTPMIAWHEGRLARRELAIINREPLCKAACPPVCVYDSRLPFVKKG